MNTWPWTNLNKELEKRYASTQEYVSFASVDEMMEHIKSIKTPWYESMYNNVMWTLNDWVWYIYRQIRPCHAAIRDAIPKTWMDDVELIRDVNFAIIKEFYEKESNTVDWTAHEEHRVFYTWLQASYEYITSGRLLKEEELQQAWERVDNSGGVAKYAQVTAIEDQITQQDDAILVQMMRYRKYFWS